ncbi:MAG TPA: serine hydrolase [Pirellulales bacterium]|nr:serine hydrolase [Pirellulales bacterium]
MHLTRLHYACLTAWLLILISAPAAADDVQAEIERYVKACVDVEQFMGAVLVVNDDRELLARGFGLANVELEVANTTKTKFRLGSITKQFTAMAIMVLAEQGKLTVDDPVARHLNDTPDAWNDVTIHHLLSHTSGIPNFTSFPEYAATMMLPSTPSQTIARFKDKPLEFTPGEKFAYSNSGYIVLGAIIEKVSGKSYEEFLNEAIFEPLEMRDTGYDHHDQILARRAAGYDQRDGGVVNAAFIDMSVPFAAGALYSTVDDLKRWDQALRAAKLVSAESLARMFTPVKSDYGYGWQIETRCDHQAMSHGGGINGFATYLIRIPDKQALVVVLSNVVSHRPARMAVDLTSILLKEPYKLPRARHAVELDPSAFDGLVGVYRLSPELQLTITREDNRLFSAVSERSKDELFPESETEFFYKAVDAQITFVRDHKGRATRLILHQGGADTVGVRGEADRGAVTQARRRIFGVKISPLCEELRKRAQLDETAGVLVVKVFPGTTAADAGLQPGDILLSINGSRVVDVAAFLAQVAEIQDGYMVAVETVRDGQKSIKQATMKSRLRETSD